MRNVRLLMQIGFELTGPSFDSFVGIDEEMVCSGIYLWDIMVYKYIRIF